MGQLWSLMISTQLNHHVMYTWYLTGSFDASDNVAKTDPFASRDWLTSVCWTFQVNFPVLACCWCLHFPCLSSSTNIIQQHKTHATTIAHRHTELMQKNQTLTSIKDNTWLIHWPSPAACRVLPVTSPRLGLTRPVGSDPKHRVTRWSRTTLIAITANKLTVTHFTYKTPF